MRILVAAAIALTALSGCTAPDAEADAFVLHMTGAPVVDASGANFTMAMTGASGHSDHIGGHYWATPTDDPDGDFSMAKGCAHVPGADLPGDFDVTCAMEPGTWYLRGHVRMTDGEDVTNYWTNAVEVTVA